MSIPWYRVRVSEPELDWDAVLEQWTAEVQDVAWITLAEAEQVAGVSRSALRKWYRNGDIPSRLEPGPNGEQRMVPLDAVVERAGRIRRPTRPGADATQQHLVELLSQQLDRTE